MGPKIASAAACLLVAAAPVPALGFAPSVPSPPRTIAAATAPSSALRVESGAQHAADDAVLRPLDNSSAANDAPSTPARLAVAALCAVAVASALQPAAAVDASSGVVPFPVREARWALRDGCVADPTIRPLRDGCLVASDVAGAVGSSPSPRELSWSVGDGHAGETMFSGGGGGGMPVPFSPREVWFAIRHGYSHDMVARWFRSGGLVV